MNEETMKEQEGCCGGGCCGEEGSMTCEMNGACTPDKMCCKEGDEQGAKMCCREDGEQESKE